MQRALDLLPSIVYIFNQDTQSNEYANRSIGEVMGYSVEEIQAFGANMMPLLCHPDDLPRVFQHFKRISRLRDNEVIRIDYRMRHKQNRWVWFLSMDTVFDRDANGRVLRHLGVAADITQQKEAESRALEASQAAEVANEDLRTFAYSISHDMKSPANTLHLLLSELEVSHGQDLPPDALELVRLAQQTVSNMQARVGRVLDYTRMIDSDKDFAAIDLNMLVQSVLDDMMAEITGVGAQIEVEALPSVAGDAEELKVLFQNLIRNAVKFHRPDAPPVVRIYSTNPSEDSTVCVTVSDNGIGIPPDSHGNVFEMFKRLHPEKVYTGAGLGLAICRRIAISHGGDISLKSRLGAGSSFTVDLRRAEAFEFRKRVS